MHSLPWKCQARAFLHSMRCAEECACSMSWCGVRETRRQADRRPPGAHQWRQAGCPSGSTGGRCGRRSRPRRRTRRRRARAWLRRSGARPAPRPPPCRRCRTPGARRALSGRQRSPTRAPTAPPSAPATLSARKRRASADVPRARLCAGRPALVDCGVLSTECAPAKKQAGSPLRCR